MTKHRKKSTASENLEVLYFYNLWGAATEQNAHIESHHSIQESVVCQQYEFDPFRELLGPKSIIGLEVGSRFVGAVKIVHARFEQIYHFKPFHSR